MDYVPEFTQPRKLRFHHERKAHEYKDAERKTPIYN